MKITAEQLEDVGACVEQVAQFHKEWPDGARFLKKNLLRAAELGLGLDFFACVWFTKKAYREYEKLEKAAYDRFRDRDYPNDQSYNHELALAIWEVAKQFGADAWLSKERRLWEMGL